MTAYYTNEAAFGLPEAVIADRTATELVFDAGGGAPLGLTIHRIPLPAGESLSALVAANQREADRSLPSYAVLFQREAEMAGAPALELAAEWHGKDGMLYTRQAHVALDGVWLVFAGTGPRGARERCDALMDRVVATFWRRS